MKRKLENFGYILLIVSCIIGIINVFIKSEILVFILVITCIIGTFMLER